MLPVMTSASRWNGYLFSLLMLATMTYSLPELFRYAGQQDQALELYLDGDLARDFESRFDQELPLRDAAIHFWGNLRYLLFHEGQDGVVLGQEDWLYSAEELRYPAHLERIIPAHIEKLESAHRALTERGQRLILLPVPMKITTYPEYLGQRLPDPIRTLSPAFAETLTQLQLPFVDLISAFNLQRDTSPLFLARDTHWSPQGARLAAETIAAALPQLSGNRHYRTEQLTDLHHQGDLTRFILTSDGIADGYRASEIIPGFETLPVLTEFTGDALFGNAGDLGIDLVGTSYSKLDTWHFIGFLQQALSRDISSYALEAVGPYAAMDAYLEETADSGELPTTVLWEFPVRTLLRPLNPHKSWQQTLDEQF